MYGIEYKGIQFIEDPINPVARGIESSVVAEGNTCYMWFRVGEGNFAFAYSKDKYFEKYIRVPIQESKIKGYLPYVIKHNGIYYLFINNDGLKLYESTDKISWTLLNGGKNILTPCIDKGSWYYHVYNIGACFVGEKIYMLIEGTNGGGGNFNLGFSWATLDDLNFNKHITESPVIFSAGNPWLEYIPSRNVLIALFGDFSDGTWKIKSAYYNLKQNVWGKCNFEASQDKIHISDPALTETKFGILLSYTYDQKYIYQSRSNLTLKQFFDQTKVPMRLKYSNVKFKDNPDNPIGNYYNENSFITINNIKIKGSFNYITKNQGKYYLFINNSGLKLCVSTDKVNWKLLNNGKNILNTSTDKRSWYYNIFNVTSCFVGDQIYMLVEGSNQIDGYHNLGFARATLRDLNFNKHISENPVLSNAENPWMDYISSRNVLISLYVDNSNGVKKIASAYCYPGNGAWGKCNFKAFQEGVNITNPSLVSKDSGILLSYCYDNHYVCQAFSNISMEQYFDNTKVEMKLNYLNIIFQDDPENPIENYSDMGTFYSASGERIKGYYPCIIKNNKYYLFINNNGLKLYESTDKISWTLLNGGKNILTPETNKNSWYYHIYNIGACFVGDKIYMLIEGTNGLDGMFNLGFSWATLNDLNFNKHITEKPIILNAGSPWVGYIPSRNVLLSLYGDVSDGTWKICSAYHYLNDDKWKKCGFEAYRDNINITKPLLEINDSKLKLSYCYDLKYICQSISNLNMEQFFDRIKNHNLVLHTLLLKIKHRCLEVNKRLLRIFQNIFKLNIV